MSTPMTSSSTVSEMDAKSSLGVLALIYPLAIGGYPLVAGLSVLIGIDNRSLSIAFRASFLALCLVALFRVVTNRIQFTRGIIWLPIFVFWFSYLIRLALDTYINPIELSRIPSEYWLFGVFGALIPMVAFMARLDTKWSAIALRRTYYFVLFVALIVTLAFSKEVRSGASLALQIGRLSIASLNPIALGHLGGSLLILTICTLGTEVTAKSRVIFLTVFLASMILGTGLLLSASSRGPILASMTAICVLGISRLDRRKGLLISGLVIVILALGPYLAATVESTSQFNPIQRITNYGHDKSVSLRVKMYRGALDQFTDHPVFGDAIEEKTQRFYPHNLILEAFMATGIVGGLSFLILIITALVRAWRILRRYSSETWIAVLFIQALVGAMFSGSLYGSGLMWMLMAGVLTMGRPANDHFSTNIVKSRSA